MAAQMFQTISTSTALELVGAVLTATSPPGPTFHSRLDALLSDSPTSSLARGDLIEISSAAAAGKTQLLYFLCMTTVLPFELAVSIAGQDTTVVLGGRGKSVVVCDCDNGWDILRLGHMIKHYIKNRIAQSPAVPADSLHPDVIQDATQTALRHLHIFRPTSTLSLAATLQALPAYHRTKMRDETISMVMIDSMTAFYWADRWDLERTRGAQDSHPMNHVKAALNILRRQLGVVVFMTTQQFFPDREATPSVLHRGHIPEPTYLITLSKTPTPPYPPSITLGQAKADTQRKEAVKDARVEGHVKDRGMTFDYGIASYGLLVE